MSTGLIANATSQLVIELHQLCNARLRVIRIVDNIEIMVTVLQFDCLFYVKSGDQNSLTTAIYISNPFSVEFTKK